jgi:hypothetical protein
MLRIKKAEFVTSCSLGTPLPDLGGAAQIAMVGKSNVGKSSFINALCGNGRLARISSSPGKTRLINFFSVNGGEFYLVDLPGYGFAKAPKSEQEKWAELMEGYLRTGGVTTFFCCWTSGASLQTRIGRCLSGCSIIISPTRSSPQNRTSSPERSGGCGRIRFKSSGRPGYGHRVSADEKLGMDDVLNRIEQIVYDEARAGKPGEAAPTRCRTKAERCF